MLNEEVEHGEAIAGLVVAGQPVPVRGNAKGLLGRVERFSYRLKTSPLGLAWQDDWILPRRALASTRSHSSDPFTDTSPTASQ